MTEPNRIFRCACPEEPSYSDASSSRRFKYKMKAFSKGVHFRTVLKILICILGFLFIAFSFIVIGLLLYPNLTDDCKKADYEPESQINGYHVLSIGEILTSMGICKESDHTTSGKILQLNNNNHTENSFERKTTKFQASDECKCSNLNESENKSSDLIGKCICNKTHETDASQTSKIRSKSKNYNTYLLNTHNRILSEDFHPNETEIKFETHSIHINACDCSKTRKIESVNMNGTYSDVLDISKCKCPEIIKDNLGMNDSITGNSNDKPIDIHQCKCPNVRITGDAILNTPENDAKFGVAQKKDNGCVCPEIPEKDDFNVRKTANESKKHGIVSMSISKVFDTVNSQFNETESGSVRKSLKNECVCPKTRWETDVILNGTNTKRDSDFTADEGCTCPEILEIDNFDLKETPLKKKSGVFRNLDREECLCPIRPEMSDNSTTGSDNATGTFGVKSVDGKCICSTVLHYDNIHVNKTGSINIKEAIHDNVTGTINEKDLNYEEEKNVNEKAKSNGEQTEQTANEEEKANGEETANAEKLNVSEEKKTVNEKILDEEMEIANIKETTSDYETEAVNENRQNKGEVTVTTNGDKQSYDNATEITKEKELNAGEEADFAYGKTQSYDNETESIKRKRRYTMVGIKKL